MLLSAIPVTNCAGGDYDAYIAAGTTQFCVCQGSCRTASISVVSVDGATADTGPVRPENLIVVDLFCDSAPCNNGGTCNGLTGMCECADGFLGANCETNIDECASNPCRVGSGPPDAFSSACVDGVNSFTCTCLPGRSGPLCATDDVLECQVAGLPAKPNPCEYGAECVQLETWFSWSCVCPAGMPSLPAL